MARRATQQLHRVERRNGLTRTRQDSPDTQPSTLTDTSGTSDQSAQASPKRKVRS